MACNGCNDRCVEITSDQCVKYTGADIDDLNIENGDPLSEVIEAITDYLQTVLDGSGIIPTIEPSIICDIVDGYLPSSGDITINDVFSAIIQAVCDLKDIQDQLVADITTLNANYTIGCLSGVTASSDTHDIVQAVITKLCSLDESVTLLSASLNNYVLKSEINTYIAAYIAGTSANLRYRDRMVPYAVQQFYGDLSGKFGATGAGIVGTEWESIYLCNGLNSTPDLRGWISIGATEGIGGGAYADNRVEPGVGGDSYILNEVAGANSVALAVSQMPLHTHTATVVQTPHRHVQTVYEAVGNGGNIPVGYTDVGLDVTGTYYTEESSISISISNSNTGSGTAHNNIPPVKACYYIMYIP